MGFRLIQGDCLEKMKDLPSESVSLVILDPPYYKIMVKEWNGTRHEWDNQWTTFSEYLLWLKSVLLEVKRIMKENGSLFLFADDKRSARIRLLGEELGWSLINEIIWVKKNNMPIRGWHNFRSFAPITERLLFFGMAESEYEQSCDGLISRTFSELRDYLISEKNKVGLTLDEVNELVGTASMAGRHYFANSQWCFPTKEHYERMQLTFNVVFKKKATVGEASKMNNEELREGLRRDYEVLREDYEVLREDYEDLREDYEVLREDYEDLRRYFKPKRNFTDVWTTSLTSSTDEQVHPTQKPLSIIRRIVETCSKEGGVVLDPFMGSGTTGIVCKTLNREFIGIEKDEEYFKISTKRISEESKQKCWGSTLGEEIEVV